MFNGIFKTIPASFVLLKGRSLVSAMSFVDSSKMQGWISNNKNSLRVDPSLTVKFKVRRYVDKIP